MKLLVLSDSHGRADNIRLALERQATRPDTVLFLGDGLSDFRYVDLGDIPLISVRGNCDMFRFDGGELPPSELVVNLDGRNILMLHGNTRGVERGLDRAIMRAVEADAEVLLYGHTHVKYQDFIPAGTKLGLVTLAHDLYIFNPGSIGAPRDGGAPSFGVVDLCRTGVLCGWGRV